VDNTGYGGIYKVAQKSKPLPNYQNIVLLRIKACHIRQIKVSMKR